MNYHLFLFFSLLREALLFDFFSTDPLTEDIEASDSTDACLYRGATGDTFLCRETIIGDASLWIGFSMGETYLRTGETLAFLILFFLSTLIGVPLLSSITGEALYSEEDKELPPLTFSCDLLILFALGFTSFSTFFTDGLLLTYFLISTEALLPLLMLLLMFIKLPLLLLGVKLLSLLLLFLREYACLSIRLSTSSLWSSSEETSEYRFINSSSCYSSSSFFYCFF